MSKIRSIAASVTFFTTNEHVFSILATVYTSQHGLHEATASTEAMKAGVNKGLEDVAELGRELERAALKAGYGSTISRRRCRSSSTRSRTIKWKVSR